MGDPATEAAADALTDSPAEGVVDVTRREARRCIELPASASAAAAAAMPSETIAANSSSRDDSGADGGFPRPLDGFEPAAEPVVEPTAEPTAEPGAAGAAGPIGAAALRREERCDSADGAGDEAAAAVGGRATSADSLTAASLAAGRGADEDAAEDAPETEPEARPVGCSRADGRREARAAGAASSGAVLEPLVTAAEPARGVASSVAGAALADATCAALLAAPAPSLAVLRDDVLGRDGRATGTDPDAVVAARACASELACVRRNTAISASISVRRASAAAAASELAAASRLDVASAARSCATSAWLACHDRQGVEVRLTRGEVRLEGEVRLNGEGAEGS